MNRSVVVSLANRRKRIISAGFVACYVLTSMACSSGEGRVPVVPVKGRVSFNGEATRGAFVVFHPRSPDEKVFRPRAQVAEDGTFQLTTYDANDGAPPGDYAVTVEWNKLIVKGRDVSSGPNVIPAQYGDSKTTPLKASVADAATELHPFDIKK